MAYIYDLTDTWNASGTTFNGIKLNVTNTASASGSKLVTLQIGGTEHFSVTKAGVGYFSGNVGIGTSSPSSYGRVASVGSAANQASALGAADTTVLAIANTSNANINEKASLVLSSNSSSKAVIAGYFAAFNGAGDTATGLLFATQATAAGGVLERMRIDASGNVGIGTSSPSSRLTITGGTTEIRDGNYLMLRPVGNGWDMRLQATGTQLDVLSGGAPGSPIMSLVNGGNVGIGTSSPGSKLEVVAQDAIRITGFQPFQTWRDSSDSNKGFRIQTAGGATLFSNDSTGGGTYTERMRIDSGGRVLIGTTATVGGTWSNEVKQTSSGVWPWGLNCVDRGLIVRNSSASSGFYAYFEYNGGTNNGSISWSGGTTSYNTTSDYRLKNINGPLKNSGAYIDALNPVEGSWKADGKRFIGLIAHQVQEVSQTSVVVGEKDGAEMQQMDYSAPELIANLIAEVQSLRARVAQLEGN